MTNPLFPAPPTRDEAIAQFGRVRSAIAERTHWLLVTDDESFASGLAVSVLAFGHVVGMRIDMLDAKCLTDRTTMAVWVVSIPKDRVTAGQFTDLVRYLILSLGPLLGPDQPAFEASDTVDIANFCRSPQTCMEAIDMVTTGQMFLPAAVAPNN